MRVDTLLMGHKIQRAMILRSRSAYDSGPKQGERGGENQNATKHQKKADSVGENERNKVGVANRGEGDDA